jgi:hypothetical protein
MAFYSLQKTHIQLVVLGHKKRFSNIMDKEMKMKSKNGNPRALISIAVAGACTIAFSGCLPYPPATKLALFYQIAPTANEERSWIKRWVPETGNTEVLLQQLADSGGLNIELLTDPQPSGTVITLVRFHPPSTSWSVLVADSPNPQPTLLYTQTVQDNGDITGGRWHEWAPDGKHVAMQINKTVWLSQPDGVFRFPIGTAEVENDWVETLHGWSPESSKIAWTRKDDILDIYEANTGTRWTFSIEDNNNSEEYRPRFIWGPDWFDGMNFAMGLQIAMRNYVDFYTLEYPAPKLADSTTSAAAAVVNSSPNSRYIVQADDNGDGTYVNALLLDTRTPDAPGTPLPAYRKIAWAPDSSHLAVVTDEAEASECSVSVVKTSDNPRTVAQVAENTSCLVFWSTPGTP